MIDHDKNVGSVLDAIDAAGITKDTIVIYGTDNGPHMNTWPDAAMTPFRNEKNSGWEGAFRVPFMVRWPGHIKPGQVSNEIMSNLDWLPTLLAAAGEPDVKQKLLQGHKAAGKDFKVHLDGYSFLPYLTGKAKKGPRKEFFYFSDDGDLMALRFENWKLHFMTQETQGTLKIWAAPFTKWRLPLIINLMTDPYERAPITSNTYGDWMIDRAYLLVPAQAYVGKFMKTFIDYPPSQKAATFTVGDALKVIEKAGGGK